jgi:hypothetical protein
MADLFISHSSMDVEWTRDLRRQLEAAGYTCWMAPDDVQGPTPWAEQILEAIEACRVMIVVISRHANASAHVSKEVGAALEHDKPLLPIRTEAIVPTGSLNYLLQLVQWVDAFPGELTQHLDRIRRAVAYSIPSATEPTAAAATAATEFGAPAWSAPAPTDAPAGPPSAGPGPGTFPSAGIAGSAGPPTQPLGYSSPKPAATPMPPPVSPTPPVSATPPPYAPPAYVSTQPAWTPTQVRPAAPSPSRTPLILAGSAGLLAAVVIIGGVLAFSGQRPAATTVPTSPLTAAPSFGPSAQPSVEPSVVPSVQPSTTSVVPSHTAPPTATPHPTVLSASALAALVPDQVDGIVLTTAVQHGDSIFGSDSGSAAMRGFLAGHGKTPADMIAASARDVAGSRDLQIFLFYVPDIAPDELLAAVLASGSITFTDAQITVVTTGGRRVTSVTSSSDAPAYLYTADGVVVVVVTSDATLAAHAIERTPAVP